MDTNLWLDSSGQILPEFYRLFDNFVGVMPAVDALTADYQDFARRFKTRPLEPVFFTSFNKEPNAVAGLAYDAVFAMARAWHDAIEVNKTAFMFMHSNVA